MNPRLKDHLPTPINQEQVYEEMLDDVHGEVNICGYSYSAAYALQQIDPTAYRCGMVDYFGCSDEFVEYGGEMYRREEMEEAVDSAIAVIEREKLELENTTNSIQDEADAMRDTIERLEAELEAHQPESDRAKALIEEITITRDLLAVAQARIDEASEAITTLDDEVADLESIV